jgi:hypothetical protein
MQCSLSSVRGSGPCRQGPQACRQCSLPSFTTAHAAHTRGVSGSWKTGACAAMVQRRHAILGTSWATSLAAMVEALTGVVKTWCTDWPAPKLRCVPATSIAVMCCTGMVQAIVLPFSCTAQHACRLACSMHTVAANQIIRGKHTLMFSAAAAEAAFHPPAWQLPATPLWQLWRQGTPLPRAPRPAHSQRCGSSPPALPSAAGGGGRGRACGWWGRWRPGRPGTCRWWCHEGGVWCAGPRGGRRGGCRQ